MPSVGKLTATIIAGQSLSPAVSLGNVFVVGLVMPSEWTTAHVSVQVSPDGVVFSDLFNFDEQASTTLREFRFNVEPGAIVAIDPDTMLMAKYIRLRSGTRDEPVVQQAARVFTVITVNQAAVRLSDETDSA